MLLAPFHPFNISCWTHKRRTEGTRYSIKTPTLRPYHASWDLGRPNPEVLHFFFTVPFLLAFFQSIWKQYVSPDRQLTRPKIFPNQPAHAYLPARKFAPSSWLTAQNQVYALCMRNISWLLFTIVMSAGPTSNKRTPKLFKADS